MNLNAHYDAELSMNHGITVFQQDDFKVTHSFLQDLIDKEILKGIDLQHVPKDYIANVIVKMQVISSEIIIYSSDLKIPEGCYEEQFLNTNMVTRAKKNDNSLGFNFVIPNENDLIKISFSMKE